MEIEIKKHHWEEYGESYFADFFPFVDGKPRHDLNNCENCVFWNFDDKLGICDKARELNGESDDRLYPFCGDICGYFKLRGDLSS